MVKVPDAKHFFHIGQWNFFSNIRIATKFGWELAGYPTNNILHTIYDSCIFTGFMDFWKFFSGPFLEFFRIFDPNFFWKFCKTIAAIWYLLPFSTMLFQMQQKFPPVFPVFSEKNFVWHSVLYRLPVIVNLWCPC